MKGIVLLLLGVLLVFSEAGTFDFPCKVCHQIVSEFQRSVPRKPTQLVLDSIATRYCIKKGLQKPNVCRGAVHEMMDSIINSVWRHYTDPHSVCHKLRLCPKEYKLRNLTQNISQILEGRPNKTWQTPTKKRTLRVMHISDVHVDLYYTVGAAAKCSEPVCCRSNVTSQMTHKEVVNRVLNKQYLSVTEPTDSPASYWGSLSNCDLPFQTFQLFVEEVAKMNDVDLILWTGDNTPHDVWQQTQSYNLNYTFIESQKLKKATNIRVIAAMGNHESFPVNVYDYEGEREKMLIEGLAQAWKPWLDRKAYEMLRTRGYYSIQLPALNNIKVISVNTQAQNDMNWYLMRNPTDAGGMLKWIEDQLKQSQAKGQFVWIIGHISPKSALNEWSMRFNALTQRYSYTIRGQFYGHSHTDHIGFFPQYKNYSKVTNYFFIAPSLTTYSNKHPEYRIMTIDYDTLQVLDYDQYRLDISKFTKKEQPAKFEKFYSFKEAYKLDDLSLEGGMTSLRARLTSDNATQILYSHLRSSGTQAGRPGKDVQCDIVSAPQYSALCHNKTVTPSNLQKYAGPWRDLQHK